MSEESTISPAEERSNQIWTVSIQGFKSLKSEQAVELRPLTVLSGANSSGKSSIMQCLLILKQTLESTYDPGPLRLHGPNVKFTSTRQLLTIPEKGSNEQNDFSISFEEDDNKRYSIFYKRNRKKAFDIEKVCINTPMHAGEPITLYETMSNDDASSAFAALNIDFPFANLFSDSSKFEWKIKRNRCFLDLAVSADKMRGFGFNAGLPNKIRKFIQELIHVPGLRGNPERTYPVSAVGQNFSGTFDIYTASVIANWQDTNKSRIRSINEDLNYIGLTSKVVSLPVNDTQVELKVGRLPTGSGKSKQLVNIADVGLGVSQCLPVIVALYAAKKGQLVYIEQPEIHLHPLAQYKLAKVLCKAINRGVKVVIETHSSILLVGIQTLVAKGELKATDVKLHWFQRNDKGYTSISKADLDVNGAFGNWPEDFAATSLEADTNYLDAVHDHDITKDGDTHHE